jgi:hypothetical protein
MTDSSPCLPTGQYEILKYIVRPSRDTPKKVKDLVSRLLLFPCSSSDSEAFIQRRKELLEVVASCRNTSTADAAQGHKQVHGLQEIAAEYTYEDNAMLARRAAQLLKGHQKIWDPAGLKDILGRGSLLERIVTVEALRDLLVFEYEEASEACHPPEEKVCKKKHVRLPSRAYYTPQGLQRLCHILKLLLSSGARHCWNILFPPQEEEEEDPSLRSVPPKPQTAWDLDLQSLRRFSENLLVSAHQWKKTQNPRLVSGFKRELLKITALSRHGSVSTRDACEAAMRLVGFSASFFLQLHYHSELTDVKRLSGTDVAETAEAGFMYICYKI